MTPNLLTIAGSDSGGGAGIQADLKTFMAFDCYGLSVITALTAQNGNGVAGIEAPSPEFVALQLQTVLAGYKVASAKTGMLFSAAIIEAVAPFLHKREWPLVVDPICVSQSGSKLLQDEAIGALTELVIPGCDLLTPNAPEAETLTGIRVNSEEAAFAAAEKLIAMGAKAVLVKGGHMPGAITVTDYLLVPGQEPRALAQAKIETENTHGTGCTLSAAIAAGMGHGLPLEVAVAQAQRFINLALRKSYNPGLGFGPVNHAAGLARQS